MCVHLMWAKNRRCLIHMPLELLEQRPGCLFTLLLSLIRHWLCGVRGCLCRTKVLSKREYPLHPEKLLTALFWIQIPESPKLHGLSYLPTEPDFLKLSLNTILNVPPFIAFWTWPTQLSAFSISTWRLLGAGDEMVQSPMSYLVHLVLQLSP